MSWDYETTTFRICREQIGVHTPTSSMQGTAERVMPKMETTGSPLLTCWIRISVARGAGIYILTTLATHKPAQRLLHSHLWELWALMLAVQPRPPHPTYKVTWGWGWNCRRSRIFGPSFSKCAFLWRHLLVESDKLTNSDWNYTPLVF